MVSLVNSCIREGQSCSINLHDGAKGGTFSPCHSHVVAWLLTVEVTDPCLVKLTLVDSGFS